MRTFILSALLLATAAPVLAQVPPPEARVDRPDDRRDGDRRDGDRRDDRGPGGHRPDDRGPGDRRPDERREYRQDERRDVRQDERRDVRQDERRDLRQDERRDFRDERRDFRQDERRDFRDDRRGYGEGDRYARFHGDRFEFPRGYSYRGYNVGAILPRIFLDQRYYIGQPDYYRLPPAFRGTHWTRFGPDALLVRNYDGRIVRVIRGLFY